MEERREVGYFTCRVSWPCRWEGGERWTGPRTGGEGGARYPSSVCTRGSLELLTEDTGCYLSTQRSVSLRGLTASSAAAMSSRHFATMAAALSSADTADWSACRYVLSGAYCRVHTVR